MHPVKKIRAGKGTGTLKLSARNVMLYRSEYDRKARATRQTYVAGFSRSASQIPPAFLATLKKLVCEPERQQQMLSRIETEVLVPARQRVTEAAERQARIAALAPLAEARRAVVRAARCAESQTTNPELNTELSKLREALAIIGRVNPTATTTDSDLDAAIAHLDAACAEVSRAVQALPKRAAISTTTVNCWQLAWYSYKDMLAVATGRAALKRPAGWSDPSIRAAVALGQDANHAAVLRGRSALSEDVG